MKQEQENIRKEHLEGSEDPWKLQSDNRDEKFRRKCARYTSATLHEDRKTSRRTTAKKKKTVEKRQAC